MTMLKSSILLSKIGFLVMRMGKVVFSILLQKGVLLRKEFKISWTQVETGSAVTWKYPSCLHGDNSVGEFYSVAITNNFQQADTGTKMIHLGKKAKSTIISREYLQVNHKTHTEERF